MRVKKNNNEDNVIMVSHYIPEAPINAYSMVSGKVDFKYSYFVEKFIDDFKKLSYDKLPETFLSNLREVKIPADIIPLMIQYSQTVREYDYAKYSGSVYYYGNRSTLSVADDITYHSKGVIDTCLNMIINENADILDDEAINYFISLNINNAKLFIEKNRLTKDAARYLVLVDPSTYIPLLDEKNLLEPEYIRDLLLLSPLSLYFTNKDMNVWKKKRKKYDNDDEKLMTFTEYASSAIDYLLTNIKTEQTLNKLLGDVPNIFTDSMDTYYFNRSSYSGFSWALGLNDRTDVLSYFLNIPVKAKGLNKLRNVSDNMIYVENPTDANLISFCRKIIKFLKKSNSDMSLMRSDRTQSYIDYITKHKDNIPNDLIEEITDLYFPNILLDELHEFGTDEKKKRR